MKFVLAPDSFKESMTSFEACSAMERGIKRVIKDAKCIKVPMADGGEGTMEVLVNACSGEFHNVSVHDPLNRIITAKIGYLTAKKTAVLEMAEASGLMLVDKKDRNPLITTTYGTGEMIKKALDLGAKHIILGIGGSATNDGGAGMMQSLGASFKDKFGCEISFGGISLKDISRVDLSNLDKRLNDVSIEVLSDVTNPLIGENGASRVFAKQKGANEDMINVLEENLEHFSRIIKRDMKIDIAYREGAGAAGGLGASLIAFLNVKLTKGIDIVIKYTDLEEKIKNADYIFTGEGSIDNQTIYGKVPVGVSRLAKKMGIPVIAFAGGIGKVDKLYDEGITAIFSILSSVTSLDDALKNGKINLENSSESVCRLLYNKCKLHG